MLQELLQLLPVRQLRYLLRQLPIELCSCCMLLLLRPQPGATGFELKHQVISFDAVSSLQDQYRKFEASRRRRLGKEQEVDVSHAGAAAGSADTTFMPMVQGIKA
jgi:hypothetical protein